jgi:hypothetical protein
MNIPDEIAKAKKIEQTVAVDAAEASAEVAAGKSKFEAMIVSFGPQVAMVAAAALLVGAVAGYFLAKI